ncbi:hypothetical protein BY996DRAFT_6560985 [Phakopsora pachyrhizi]|nr:hypothetical protein BY996DRAFT_6560985 [Phakopsora pachyrhizi]
MWKAIQKNPWQALRLQLNEFEVSCEIMLTSSYIDTQRFQIEVEIIREMDMRVLDPVVDDSRPPALSQLTPSGRGNSQYAES